MGAEKKDWKDKLKLLSYKKLIKIFTGIMGILLIVFMTVANIIFDPDNLDFNTWLTNSLILVGIMVFGMLMGESMGHDKQTERPNGLYQTKLREYGITRSSIDDVARHFSQFFPWYTAHENINVRVQYLVEHNFDQDEAEAIVKYVRWSDLDKLEAGGLFYVKDKYGHPVKDENGVEVVLDEMTPAKMKFIRDLFETVVIKKNKTTVIPSKVSVRPLGYSYYLSATGEQSCGSILDESRKIRAERVSLKRFNRTYKIVASLIISLIWAMLTVREFMDANDITAWINLISRLTALVTSFCSGWATSVMDTKLAAAEIDIKITVLKFFKQSIEDKSFVPKSYSEKVLEKMSEQGVQPAEPPKVISLPAVMANSGN